MTDQERENFLLSYFNSNLSRNDLHDGKIAVIRARAKECDNFPGLVEKLLSNKTFCVAYSYINPYGYINPKGCRTAETGDARPYRLQQAERAA